MRILAQDFPSSWSALLAQLLLLNLPVLQTPSKLTGAQ